MRWIAQSFQPMRSALADNRRHSLTQSSLDYRAASAVRDFSISTWNGAEPTEVDLRMWRDGGSWKISRPNRCRQHHVWFNQPGRSESMDVCGLVPSGYFFEFSSSPRGKPCRALNGVDAGVMPPMSRHCGVATNSTSLRAPGVRKIEAQSARVRTGRS